MLPQSKVEEGTVAPIHGRGGLNWGILFTTSLLAMQCFVEPFVFKYFTLDPHLMYIKQCRFVPVFKELFEDAEVW